VKKVEKFRVGKGKSRMEEKERRWEFWVKIERFIKDLKKEEEIWRM